MTKPALLISDLHLSPERPAITRAFFNFLKNTATNARALYILGDLFEAWIGDDDPAELAQAVQTQLRRLSDSGVALYFLHGNRDFLVGKAFARKTGCTLLPDYHVAMFGDSRAVLLHGDTLCLDDADYQQFRRRYRHPVMLWLLRRLPLKKRQQIADDWRRKSAAANANKPENIMDVTPQAVEQIMRQYQVEIMIHGHTHRPGRHRHASGERIVLGDWDREGWYLSADDARGFELHNFAINE